MMLQEFSQITNKEWLIFLLGISVPFAIAFFKYTYLHFLYYKRASVFVGKWHMYHWSREGFKSTFHCEEWVIKRSILASLVFETHDKKRNNLKYKGSLSFEAGHVVINKRALGHRDETVQFRIQPDPIPGEHDKGIFLRGIGLCQDFDRKIYSCVILGSTKPIEEDKAKEILQKITNHSECESCIRLNEIPF